MYWLNGSPIRVPTSSAMRARTIRTRSSPRCSRKDILSSTDGAIALPARDEVPERAPLQTRLGCDRHARQRLRLVKVRRHHQRLRQQLLDERGPSLRLQELIARLGDHHRIEHHPQGVAPSFLPRISAQPLRHLGDDRRRREHADLHHVGAEVREHGLDLPADELGRQVEDALDAERVLGGHGGGHPHPRHPERPEGLQIRPDSRAAAGIGAGDRQRFGNAHRRSKYTRCRSASNAKGRGPLGYVAGITSVNSPRGSPAASRARCAGGVALTMSSYCLVSSRATTSSTSPNTSPIAPSVATMRCGDSYSTTVVSSARSAWRRWSRLPGFTGRNPSNTNRSAGRPEAESAATTAAGPGIGTTATPWARAPPTSRMAGSEIPGVPASVTSAIERPAAGSRRSAGPRVSLLCS